MCDDRTLTNERAARSDWKLPRRECLDRFGGSFLKQRCPRGRDNRPRSVHKRYRAQHMAISAPSEVAAATSRYHTYPRWRAELKAQVAAHTHLTLILAKVGAEVTRCVRVARSAFPDRLEHLAAQLVEAAECRRVEMSLGLPLHGAGNPAGAWLEHRTARAPKMTTRMLGPVVQIAP